MHKNTDDRRAKRSRRLLKEGLLELMKEKCFKDISARDITERADLNRGTFYLHYPDTQTLLGSIEDDIIAEAQELADSHKGKLLAADFRERPSLRPILLPILVFIEEKHETISLLLRNSNANSFLDKLRNLIYRNSVDYARVRYRIPDAQLDYFLGYVSFGIMGMLREWTGRGMTLPKEQLIAYMDELVEKSSQARL